MKRGDAEGRAAKPGIPPGGSGRNQRGTGWGASSGKARREDSSPGAMQLMEAVVELKNMTVAYQKVKANKGAAGIASDINSDL